MGMSRKIVKEEIERKSGTERARKEGNAQSK